MSPFLAWLWGEGGGISNGLKLPFSAAAWLYGGVIGLRIFLYRTGLLPTKRVDCHVVSVGNLTTGGTGKTPVVLYLAEQWQARGKRVGIVSRGYRRKKKDGVVLVSDGEQVLETAEAVGDEAYLMAERLKGIPVAVAADRYAGCRFLQSRFAVDVILLDDGFQHLRLHRDLNLLLVDATKPFGNGHLLPRGALREPLSQMQRADMVILTRADDQVELDKTMSTVSAFGLPTLQSCFQPTGLVNLKTAETRAHSELSGQSVLPVCGIGNPDAFLRQLADLGAKLESPMLFPDHHPYGPADLERIDRVAEAAGLRWIVTTEKDAVKIKALDLIHPMAAKFYALRIGPIFKDESGPAFRRLFEK